jgi:predicted RNase H-like HicB family nuclease
LLAGAGNTINGHLLLTVRVRFEDGYWVGDCIELGVPSFGETLEQAINAVEDATLVYLNTIEAHGDRERIFKERGLEIRPGQPEGFEDIEIRAHAGETVSPRSVALLATVG